MDISNFDGDEETRKEIISLKLQILNLQRKYEQKLDYYKHILDYNKFVTNKYKTIVENASDVVWVMDLDTLRLTDINSGIYELTGYTPDEMLQKSISEILLPESVNNLLEVLANKLDRYDAGDMINYNETYEWKQYCKDGSVKIVETTSNFVYSNSNAKIYVSGIARDIAKHKKELAGLHEEINDLRENIKKRDELFTIVEQELKNPVAGLLNIASLLCKPYGGLSETERSAFYVRYLDNLRQIYAFMQDLTEWTNLQRDLISYSPFDFDINLLIKRIIYQCKNDMSEKKIVITSTSNVNYIFADLFMTEYVLQAVINRIAEFPHDSGKIEIVTGKSDTDISKINIRIYDNVSKGDNGITDDMFQIGKNLLDNEKDAMQIKNFKLVLAKSYMKKNNGDIATECGDRKCVTIVFQAKKEE